MTAPREPDDHDPLAAYADGDPDAVRAAAPPEPTEAEWDAACRCIGSRLGPPPRPSSRRFIGYVLAAAGSVAAAAAVAWAVFVPTVPPPLPGNRPEPEVVEVAPSPNAPTASVPHESAADPLAEFAVLPVAHEDEVVLSRVPGAGWLPIGADPLPGTLPLATADDVRVEDAEATWPKVAPAPGYAPMIFAIKPR